MFKINENYLELQGSYLFSEIAKRERKFREEHKDADIIKLGIGDVTRPLVPAVVTAIKKAVDEMAVGVSFRGYGPEQGYDFLRAAIAEGDYQSRGVDIKSEEIFVSDGAKCDTGNIQELFSADARIAVTDPVYPVYVDTNVMAGRSGAFDAAQGRYTNIEYLDVTSENGFIPALPKQRADVIYLCYPNNPTGTALGREALKKWVDYAKANKSLILYDSAYEAYVKEENIPRSIYEIEGAKEVAIEFRSFSKTAGFTGARCAYTVVPKGLAGYDSKGEAHAMNAMWVRRHTTKFNGVPYYTQRGAEACYSAEGRAQIQADVDYYLQNTKIILKGLKEIGVEAVGGVNSPYVWLKCPGGMKSWDFFDKLITEAHVVGTPGAGFGRSGEGYFRLTGFNTRERTQEAIERLIKLK
jgi:LL-diaminopimelate aminotransferase